MQMEPVRGAVFEGDAFCLLKDDIEQTNSFKYAYDVLENLFNSYR